MYCNTINSYCVHVTGKKIKINLTSSGRTVSTSNKNDIWCGFPPNLPKKKLKKKNYVRDKKTQLSPLSSSIQ